MFNDLSKFLLNPIFNDAPEPYQLNFQDGATPGFQGIVDLHDSVLFHLILISVGVFWVLGSIIINFSNKNSPITYKYANHGTLFKVPTYSNIQIKRKTHIRYYSNRVNRETVYNQTDETLNIHPIVTYNDLGSSSKKIKTHITENKGKAGIYRFINKLNGKTYVGSSSNLGNRFIKHFNLNYISNHKNTLSISRAFIKYGYSNFNLEILEYCPQTRLLDVEQHYLDLD